jgi:hypothetical protein
MQLNISTFSSKRLLLVERERAAVLVLLSVISFAATVVGVRLFLELTGYPQVGGGQLHIAHLLWGGLAMMIGLFIVLIWDNPDVLYVTSILSGVGMGLFIDEVGKFITKNNDYFFPAAAPLIYAVFLVVLILYLLVRRKNKPDPQRAMALALEGLKEMVYGQVDEMEGQRILNHLALARQSDNSHIAEVATMLYEHLSKEQPSFADYQPGLFRRLASTLKGWGLKLGRKWHRRLILVGLGLNAVATVALLLLLLIYSLAPHADFSTQMMVMLMVAAQKADAGGVTGQMVRLALNFLVGATSLVAMGLLLRGKERAGMAWALVQEILSLTALQMVTFYLTQFTAVLPTIFQFLMLALILTYQRWYLDKADDS